MKRNRTAVIGLGNRLLADEGAGLHAIDLLRDQTRTLLLKADLVEAGTPGMNLLHEFDEREKIIFIDAGNCGIPTGDYRRFRPDEVVSLKKSKDFSLHEFDLMGFLEFAKSMALSNGIDIVIYCIQAAEVKMSESLSSVVQKKLPQLVSDVLAEIGGEAAHA